MQGRGRYAHQPGLRSRAKRNHQHQELHLQRQCSRPGETSGNLLCCTYKESHIRFASCTVLYSICLLNKMLGSYFTWSLTSQAEPGADCATERNHTAGYASMLQLNADGGALSLSASSSTVTATLVNNTFDSNSACRLATSMDALTIS
jgi:hypothetical protein